MKPWFVLSLLWLFIQALSSQNVDPESLLAEQWFQKGEFNKATELYKKVLSKNYDEVEANYALGKIYFLQKNWEESWHYLRETLSIQRDYRDARALYDQVLERLKETYKSTNDNSAVAYRITIHLHLLENQLREAGILLERALAQHPRDGFLWDHKANWLYRQKKTEEALKALKEAISLAPTSATIFRHYESAWYQFYHNTAPAQRTTSESEELRIQNLQKLKEEGVLGTEDLTPSVVGTPKVAEENSPEDTTPVVSPKGDQEFFQRLLTQQAQFIPPALPPKPVEKVVEETPYVPPPTTTVISETADLVEKDLITRANQAYEEKNWNLAVNNYTVLVFNNPSNSEYKEKLEKAKAYDDFEARLFNARREFALASRNPALLDSARELFLALEKDIYFELYHKKGFEDYLGKIAFQKGNFKQASDLFLTWLQSEPRDEEILWLNILCLDALGEWDLAHDALKQAEDSLGQKLSKWDGIGRLRTKLMVWSLRYLFIILAIIWIVLTFVYTSYKSMIAKRKLDRRRNFELIRELNADKSYKQMNKLIDEVLLLELSESEIYNLQILKTNGLYYLQQFDAAERQVRSILGRNKNDNAALSLLGKIHVALQKTEEDSLPAYRVLVSKEPSNLELLRLYLATLKANKNVGDEFERIALKLLEIESYNKGVLQDLVDLYSRIQKKGPKVLDVYKQYLDVHPSNLLAKLHYLDCLVDAGSYIEAVKTGKELLNINPDLDKAHRLLIQAFDKLSMHDEMKSFYSQLSLEYPQSSLVQNMYDLIQENYRSSSGVMHDDIEEKLISEDTSREIFDKAKSLVQQGDTKAAIVKLQQVYQDERFAYEAGMLLTEAFLNLEDATSAQLYFEPMLSQPRQLDTHSMEVVYRMGQYYMDKKLRKKALQCFQMIARNDVAYKDTFQKIELLGLERSP